MYINLSSEVTRVIQDEVEKARKDASIVNQIIRNDIFAYLEEYSRVLYYPLNEEEEANGIHVERWIGDEKVNFVFINTAKPLEKQVYTAAHELGHIWKIDEKVAARIHEEVNKEDIINRFAAELLMPEKVFYFFLITKSKEVSSNGKEMDFSDILSIITYLMDAFMVPYKAVIFRLEEVGFITIQSRKTLEEIERKYPEQIQIAVEKGQYMNLGRTKKKKSIGKLEQLLNLAEEKKIYSDEKIKNIKAAFGLTISDEDNIVKIPSIKINLPEDYKLDGQ